MTLINLLFEDPLRFLELMLYRVPALLLALSMHEWAHAYVANRCGDPTAAMLGRLSLNPLKHLDPIGTVMMFFVGFGWAKPVPVNPRNFKNFRRDDTLVSLAGVTMNLLLFLFFMLLCVVLNFFVWRPEFRAGIGNVYTFLNFQNGIIAHIMGYGADLFSDVLLRPALVPLLRLFAQVAQFNLLLAVFNILPIPPLDGFHVLNNWVLRGRVRITQRLSQGMTMVILLLSFSGLLSRYIFVAMEFVQGNLLRLIDWIL